MQYDSQGIFSLGRTGQEPQEAPVRKTKRSYGPRGLSEEEKRRRNKERCRNRYYSKREEILAALRTPEQRAKNAASKRRQASTPEAKERLAKISREYYHKNKEARRQYKCQPKVRQRENEKRKARRINNPAIKELHCQRSRAFWNKNKDRLNLGRRTPRRRMRENELLKQRRESDPMFAMKTILKNRTGSAFRSVGINKPASTEDLMGCSWTHLRAHLESQFLPGMTWENRGPIWHVDHIIPFAAVDLGNPSHIKAVCHYTNLRPLWGADNLSKSGRITDEVRQRMNEVFGEESIAA